MTLQVKKTLQMIQNSLTVTCCLYCMVKKDILCEAKPVVLLINPHSGINSILIQDIDKCIPKVLEWLKKKKKNTNEVQFR